MKRESKIGLGLLYEIGAALNSEMSDPAASRTGPKSRVAIDIKSSGKKRDREREHDHRERDTGGSIECEN